MNALAPHAATLPLTLVAVLAERGVEVPADVAARRFTQDDLEGLRRLAVALQPRDAVAAARIAAAYSALGASLPPAAVPLVWPRRTAGAALRVIAWPRRLPGDAALDAVAGARLAACRRGVWPEPTSVHRRRRGAARRSDWAAGRACDFPPRPASTRPRILAAIDATCWSISPASTPAVVRCSPRDPARAIARSRRDCPRTAPR